MTLIARFSVTEWDPRSFDDLGDWLAAATLTKTFSSGIDGTSTALFVASGEEGSRSYVAVERITGSVDGGEEGSLTVHHGGLESDPSTWFGHIVPGTGTGSFAGWSGAAPIMHDETGAFFAIDLAAAGDAR